MNTSTLQRMSGEGIKVKKRTDVLEPFNEFKINAAITRCIVNTQKYSQHEAEKFAEEVTSAVVNILSQKYPSPISVETVSDVVEQQLFAHGLFEVAKAFILYRDNHKTLRTYQPITTEEQSRIDANKHFFKKPFQELQFYDKYSRYRDDLGRRETWLETVQRVFDFFMAHIKTNYSEAYSQIPWAQLQASVQNLHVLPALRIMQMAGPALERCHVGAYNCLGKDTAFITSLGVKTFEDFKDGDKTLVLTHTGNWKPATVRCYGNDLLYAIEIAKGRSNHLIKATRNHTWIQRDGTRTTNLTEGTQLVKSPTPIQNWNYDSASIEERLAWCYGYVYGDGTVCLRNNKPDASLVRLCGADKEKFLSRFVELGFTYSEPASYGGDPVVYTKHYFKTLPILGKDPINVLRAFMVGWLDADGEKQTDKNNSNPYKSIQITGIDAINFARQTLPMVGAYISNEREIEMQTNLGPRSDRTVKFGLMCGMGNAPNSNHSVMSITRLDEQQVWCLEVEDDHSFVLANGIVTGNCAYLAIDNLKAFSELLYILMAGTGVGFSIESDYVDRLPRIKKQKSNQDIPTHVIADSTEGWCDALHLGLTRWFNGQDVKFDYSLLRPKGARLRIKGGRASGPEPLKNLLDFTRLKVLAHQGQKLSTLDAHDIATYCGFIVQVGGVRRAAQISLSDLDDRDMRNAKQGSFYLTEPQRVMANNSAVYDEKPSATDFMEEWLSLAKSGSGERGIFNRGSLHLQIPERRKKAKFGMNPCAEIVLNSNQFCNLSIVVARQDDTEETLKDKVRLATILGTIQSTFTDFKYINDTWKKNCEEERLLGVDITGQMDCDLLHSSDEVLKFVLTSLLDTAKSTNVGFSNLLGIKPSAAITCIKPSGNSSQLLDCSAGIHPRYAKFYIRRFQISSFGAIGQLLKDEGVPYKETPEYPDTLLFEFPVKSPNNALTRHDLTAIEQLEHWLIVKKYYTEHNPSVTIFVEPDEWLEVGNWVYKNWDSVGCISFLPKSETVYRNAPYEEITLAQYEALVAKMPVINFAKLSRYEKEDTTTVASEYACTGTSSCEL